MDEKEFIRVLSKKAEEQRKVAETEILPKWARGLGEWLVVNPWRVIVPISAIAYGILRTAYGENFREFILVIFGGF